MTPESRAVIDRVHQFHEYVDSRDLDDATLSAMRRSVLADTQQDALAAMVREDDPDVHRALGAIATWIEKCRPRDYPDEVRAEREST